MKMARYKLGERTISEADLIRLLGEEPMQSASRLAKKLDKHYLTVRKRLNELVDDGKVSVINCKCVSRDLCYYELRCEDGINKTK